MRSTHSAHSPRDLTSTSRLRCLQGKEAADSGARFLGYARRLVHVVRQLHKANILHMHLKPHNILELEDGQLVLADFGSSEYFPGAASPLENTHVLNATEFWCALLGLDHALLC